jgi:MHS family proline/betaine transporter-like MFS transporter
MGQDVPLRAFTEPEKEDYGTDKDASDPTAKPRLAWGEYWTGTAELFRLLWPAAASYAMEAFEFSLFGSSFTQIKANFFPESSELAWLCYSVPFVSRPFGGMVVGWLSDKHGRRRAVIFVSYAILITTVAQGLVPGHTGLFGALMLSAMRVFQGLAFGATTSLLVYSTEVGPRRTIAKGVLILSTGSTFGTLAGVMVFALLHSLLSIQRMDQWGWRVPYLIAFAPGLWTALQSHRLEESPEFLKSQETGTPRSPVDARRLSPAAPPNLWVSMKALFLGHSIQVLLFLGTVMVGVGTQYVGRIFAIDWLTRYAGMTETFTMWLICLNAVIGLLIGPLTAYLTDAYGASVVVMSACATNVLITIPLFILVLNPGTSKVSSLALTMAVGAQSTLHIPIMVLKSGYLPTELRGLGLGLLSNGATCIYGGLSPLFLSWLSAIDALAPAYYLAICQLASFLAVFAARECRARGTPVSHLRDDPF